MRLEPGTFVIFVDSYRKRHNALVTAVHGDPEGRLTQYKLGEDGGVVFGEDGHPVVESVSEVGVQWPCINLTYVSDDPRKEDSYGRQLERDATSVVYIKDNTAAAYCWYFPSDAAWADKLAPQIMTHRS